jgi:hypothetical protein
MFSIARRYALLVPLGLGLVLGSATSVVAASPTPVNGAFTYLGGTFGDVRMEGGNTIIGDLHATVSYSGTFAGTSQVSGMLILHPDGTANFHDVETFTGTVDGTPGTVTFRLEGRTDRAGVVNATDTMVSATGALVGLHGVLNEVGTVPNPALGPVGTYTGQIQMDR